MFQLFFFFLRGRNVKNDLRTSFRPTGLERLKRLANLIPPRRVRTSRTTCKLTFHPAGLEIPKKEFDFQTKLDIGFRPLKCDSKTTQNSQASLVFDCLLSIVFNCLLFRSCFEVFVALFPNCLHLFLTPLSEAVYFNRQPVAQQYPIGI